MDRLESQPLIQMFASEEEATKIAEKQLQELENYDKKSDNPVPLVVFEGDPGLTKQFLVLLKGQFIDGEEFQNWKICEGRKDAYDFIKDYIEYADLIESFIVAENEEITKKKRVIDFMKYVLDSGKIEDPGFDPMDYVDSYYVENNREEEN